MAARIGELVLNRPSARQRKLRPAMSFRVVVAAVLLLVGTVRAEARVTRIEIARTEPAFGGVAFGTRQHGRPRPQSCRARCDATVTQSRRAGEPYPPSADRRLPMPRMAGSACIAFAPAKPEMWQGKTCEARGVMRGSICQCEIVDWDNEQSNCR